jgi:hypothetical protein
MYTTLCLCAWTLRRIAQRATTSCARAILSTWTKQGMDCRRQFRMENGGSAEHSDVLQDEGPNAEWPPDLRYSIPLLTEPRTTRATTRVTCSADAGGVFARGRSVPRGPSRSKAISILE